MANISIMSDLHLGFKRDTEREEDALVAAENAFRKAVDMDSDLVVVAGDIFDSRLPRPEYWSKFMNMISSADGTKNIEVEKTTGRGDVSKEVFDGIPVVAVHGTHERRTNKQKNSIEAMEKAGFLIHLHCSSVELKVGDEKVGIHGMGGVPERYSKEILKKWNPEPFEDAYNIFVIHQDLKQYIYNPVSPPDLGLEDLPGGFDLYVSGHIHWKDKQKVNGKPFIIPGSLIPTQLKKKDSETPKGFYNISTQKDDIEFVEIEVPREFVYKKIELTDADEREIEKKISSLLEDIPENSEKKPLVRIKTTGNLQRGLTSSDIDLSRIEEKYSERALISFSENLKEDNTEGKKQSFEKTRENRLSVDEMGMNILHKKMDELGIDISPDEIFEDLAEGKIEAAMEKMEDKETKDHEEERNAQRSEEAEKEWWVK